MAFKIKGAADQQKPTELELVHDAKKGMTYVRAYNPNNGKKHRLVSFKNGGAYGTGVIVLHGKNSGLGFATDRRGVPTTETTATA
jgi:hypothetical protein